MYNISNFKKKHEKFNYLYNNLRKFSDYSRRNLFCCKICIVNNRIIILLPLCTKTI